MTATQREVIEGAIQRARAGGADAVDCVLVQSDQLEARVDELRDHLTRDPAAPPFLLATSATLQSFGLETERAEILPDEQRPPLSHERMHLVVSGAFRDLFRFVQHVENSRPPSRVTALSVHATPVVGVVQADLFLVRFWSPDS